jgi:predicted RNA binding protein YcfA (HicA-like mRNA interferase family)
LGKLGVFSSREICQILETHEFIKVRQKGSHIIMQKRDGDSTITVPVPNHSSIKIGTLKSIIRQSQLPRTFFEL